MKEALIKEVVRSVLERFNNGKKSIPVEASARHVHLSESDIRKLFGENAQLTKKKDLSQPGQFQCNQRVTLISAKGAIHGVAVLGPAREHTQVEISKTDARVLGINPPVRESGQLSNSASIYITTENAVIECKESVIIAKRHIHMTPEDAQAFNVTDKQMVNVRIVSERPVILEDVVVRVHKDYKLSMHIDIDEANAVGYTNETIGELHVQGQKAEVLYPICPKVDHKSTEISLNKKVISERDVCELSIKSCHKVLIPKKSIITPLALDYIKANKIQLIRT